MMDGGNLLAGLLFGGAVQLGVTAALAWWGATIGRRRGGRWRVLAWLPVAGLVLAVIGATGTTMLLVRAFRAVAEADPSLKAVLLSNGIAGAMTVTAVTAPVSWAAYLAALVGCVWGTLSAPTSRSSPS